MNCKYHNNLKATNTCNICGCWICESCALDINGRIYCKDCLKNEVKNNDLFKEKEQYKNYIYNKPITRKSGLLTLILSLIFSGLGHLYLGYKKRGLFIFALAIFSIYFYITPWTIFFLIYSFSIFDAMSLKNNLDKGIYIQDNIWNIKKFVMEHKFFTVVLLLIIISEITTNVFYIISEITTDVFYPFSYAFIALMDNFDFDEDFIIPAIICVLILLVLIKFFRNRKNDDTKQQ